MLSFALCLNACSNEESNQALGTLERDRIVFKATAAEIITALPVREGAGVKEGDLLIVKSDYSGPLEYLAKTKVLEIAIRDEDFIKGNKLASGNDLIEQPGLYMKIKQGGFNMNIDQDSFKTFAGFGKKRYARDSFVTTAPLFGVYEDLVFKPYKINFSRI